MTSSTTTTSFRATTARLADTESYIPDHKLLRVCCWCVLLALGAAQAWATRFTMNPDGISYLDIGDAYWRGDWHNAINAYWSPLYSWILGLFIKVIKPSPFWEYPLVHLVNFLIYVAALAGFEFLLSTFIKQQKERDRELAAQGEMGIPGWAWWVLGYMIFLSSSLLLVGLHLVTPDLCVAGLVYLAAALILKIRGGHPGPYMFALLGAVLGVSYLTKAVMFPLGFIFLTMVMVRKTARSWRHLLLAPLVFLFISAVFITALSRSKNRLTFGDSGRITYEIFVNNVDVFIPENAGVKHPVEKLPSIPITYKFGEPVQGTYPLWFDPTYWHEGIKPHPDAPRELDMLMYAFVTYIHATWSLFLQLSFTVSLLILYFLAPSPGLCLKTALRAWPVAIPAAIAVLLYALVYTETRYVSPDFALLWLAGFSGVRLPASNGISRITSILISLIAFVTIASTVAGVLQHRGDSIPDYVKVASFLSDIGIGPGDKLAVISQEPFGEGGAFFTRFVRARIIAQTRDSGRLPELGVPSQERFLKSLADAGVKAVVADSPTVTSMHCFHRLATTRYSVCTLQR